MISFWILDSNPSTVSLKGRPFHIALMLSDPLPQIKSMVPTPDEEAGSLLSVDLDEALRRYVRERALVVKRLKELSTEDWQRTAEHEAFSHYSVYIMFRHLLMHEMLHAYRIEELMLKKDWESLASG